MADVSKVKLGVCSATFNSVDLGHTKGGVEVTYEPVWHEVTVDKYGETVVERVLIGEKVTAKVPLAEHTVENLKVAMPGGTLVGTTTKKVTVGASAGTKKGSALSGALVLHPINESTTDFDVKLFKAHSTSEVTINHKIDEEKILEVTFATMIDETKTDGAYLAEFGNPTAA